MVRYIRLTLAVGHQYVRDWSDDTGVVDERGRQVDDGSDALSRWRCAALRITSLLCVVSESLPAKCSGLSKRGQRRQSSELSRRQHGRGGHGLTLHMLYAQCFNQSVLPHRLTVQHCMQSATQ